MKKLFFAFLLLSAATASAQTVKGDMNNDGHVTIADVSAMVDIVLGYAAEEYITATNAQDNTLVEGTWIAPDGTWLRLAKDGSTNYQQAHSFKYLDGEPGALFFFDNFENLIKAVAVKQRASNYLTLTEDGVDKKYTRKTLNPTSYTWVDLNLPSCTLWATCNVGASSPEGFGDYWAWGEVKTKDSYNWSTYLWGNGRMLLTKYCTNVSYGNDGYYDGMTELMLADDAANANWGGSWAIPTKEQWEELFANTIVTWTTQNGVQGWKIQSRRRADRRIFLPAAGENNITGQNIGYYWSKTLDESKPNYAHALYFYPTTYNLQDTYYRSSGFSVRPVKPYE